MDRIDGEDRIYVAYAHETERAAAANEERLPEVIDGISGMAPQFSYADDLTVVDTRVDGTLLTATLALAEDASILSIWGAIHSRHPLFYYE